MMLPVIVSFRAKSLDINKYNILILLYTRIGNRLIGI